MSSLPSVAINGTLKLDYDPRKHPSLFQNQTVSYPRSRTVTHFDVASESASTEPTHFVALLQRCPNRDSAEAIHAQIIKTGFYENSVVSALLVSAFTKCVSMESARKLFDELPHRNAIAWSALMAGYVRAEQPKLALEAFGEMLQAGLYPTDYTLTTALNACSSLRLLRLVEQLHGYAIKYRVDFDTSIGNALCSFYSKFRRLGSAVKAFEGIGEKNVISWTAVVSACSENGDASMGLGFFVDMILAGIEPNDFTLTSVLSLCCVKLSVSFGRQVHALSVKLQLDSNLRVRNSIMYLYLKTGRIREAKKLFDGIKVNSLITWNAMISGHAQVMELEEDNLVAYQSGNEALCMFAKLRHLGMKPDHFTYSSALTVCGGLVASEQGEQIHAQIIKTGFLSDVVVGTSLLNMYNKCGCIEKASKAFVEMSTRTLISWTSMITSFAQHGKTEQALNLFDDMRFSGIRPNHITFVGVLSACSHAGMVDRALGYFEMMQKEYRIKPVMDHYACLVDMFVRLGQLEKVFDLVKTMSFEPSEFIWSSLVAGCRSHGKLELGFYAAEQLLKLKPRDAEPYVLLLNMYLSAGKWQDVSRVRKMMKEEGLGNIKDWSWISVKDKVYSFRPSDKSNRRSTDLYTFLEDLIDQAEGIGYKKQEDLDVSDENEAKTIPSSTSFHSEKLAIAFGLLNTPNSAPIRVMKNFIMCKDCHNFIKTVSLLKNREITIRDSKRLHKIVNGKCSCGDFGSLL